MLSQQDEFADWPLETIVPNREAFFAFLQERWPAFLDRETKQDDPRFSEGAIAYAFELPGPADLPFGHDDIRVYIDNLFLEGYLNAVPHVRAEHLSSSWHAIGIQSEGRVDVLLDALTNDIPTGNSGHDDWFHFAKSWAELVSLALDSNAFLKGHTKHTMETLQTQIDNAFVHWLTNRYGGIFDLPPLSPTMLHQVPRFLSRYINEAKEHKVGLILMDGLSLDQWVVIRKELSRQSANYRFREEAVFALIPTITSVSRQAAFAGKPPFYFPDSIHTTNREPRLWTQFWVDQGLPQDEIGYAKGLGDGTLKDVEEMIARPKRGLSVWL